MSAVLESQILKPLEDACKWDHLLSPYTPKGLSLVKKTDRLMNQMGDTSCSGLGGVTMCHD